MSHTFGPMSYRPIADPALGLRPIASAVLGLLAATPLERLWEPEENIDLRVTAWYRGAGGGLLIRARRAETADPFLCLGLSEHESTGRPVIFEWVQPWTKVPPAGTDLPKGATCVHLDDDKFDPVIEHLFSRIREYMAAPAPPRPKVKGPGPKKAIRRSARV
jgi:hypothetical protein